MRRRRRDNERQGDRMKECRRKRACQESRGGCLPAAASWCDVVESSHHVLLQRALCKGLCCQQATNLCQPERLRVSTRCIVSLLIMHTSV